jgi:hypothetical protein
MGNTQPLWPGQIIKTAEEGRIFEPCSLSAYANGVLYTTKQKVLYAIKQK